MRTVWHLLPDEIQEKVRLWGCFWDVEIELEKDGNLLVTRHRWRYAKVQLMNDIDSMVFSGGHFYLLKKQSQSLIN